jgi:pimeloyl-ACP methyl ester carboxylesterase
VTATDWTSGAPGTGQYAQLNGINMYFETHGSGRPLILLHGGLGSGEMFGPILPALTERHQIIAPDLQGHGRTADIGHRSTSGCGRRHRGTDRSPRADRRMSSATRSAAGGAADAVKHPAKVGYSAASANIRRDAIYPRCRAAAR